MNISSNFTIEDIHNIRYENYEKTKTMLPKELIEKTKRGAASGWARLAELKKQDGSTVPPTLEPLSPQTPPSSHQYPRRK
jgi:hypothetical protein